jgi:hypothetical protein
VHGARRISPERRLGATKTIGKESYTDYGSDHDWELAPGTWVIELWCQGRKLAEQGFTVVKP